MDSNNEFKKEKKPVDKNKMAKVLSFITFLALIFCGAYFTTEYFNNPNKESGGDQIVLNPNIQLLKDDALIILKTKENIDSEKKISELKVEFGLSDNLTKESLEEALKIKGYSLSELTDDKLVFTREFDHILEANKYYLGEKNGDIAIFKTNDSGVAKEEYISTTPINILPSETQKALKNLDKYYDTEEEARIRLTAYTS